jgi:drug/metabolite transporter (DMT)-like permease
MGALGVALMYLPQFSTGAGGSKGLMFGALGTLFFCVGNLASVAARRRGASLVSSTAWGFVYGVLVILVACLSSGARFIVDPSPGYLLSLAWLAGPCSIGAILVYLALVDRIGVARASYATVLFPVLSLAISTFAEGYAWTPSAVAGVVVALAGNVVMQTRIGS